jgi:hypothetical protein
MNQQIDNALSNKFNILSCYDEHGTMIFYELLLLLSLSFVTRNQHVEFFTQL